MKRAPSETSPEAERLLAVERDVPAAPPELKARALERARVSFLERRAEPSLPRSRRWWTFAIAAALAVAGISFAALHSLSPSVPASVPSSPREGDTRPPTPAKTAETKTETPPERTQIPDRPPALGSSVASAAPRRLPESDGHAVELALLQRARNAVASGRFSAALESIAEHQRRFPNGLLHEEREALRVKALAGLGKTEDARAAARRFRETFPNSVLSPRLEATTQRAP